MRIIFTLLLLLVSATGCAAPKADLWPYWQQSDEANTATIDHSLWQHTLNKYLVQQPQQTLFRYQAVSSNGKYDLDRYIRKLTATDPRGYSKDEQFAYWVNLYNALTVQLILDNYPLKSITKLGGFFSASVPGTKSWSPLTTTPCHSTISSTGSYVRSGRTPVFTMSLTAPVWGARIFSLRPSPPSTTKSCLNRVPADLSTAPKVSR